MIASTRLGDLLVLRRPHAAYPRIGFGAEVEPGGLVVRRVDGTKRPRRLAKGGVEAMDQWLAMLRKALEKSYDRLDEVLASMDKPKRGEER